MLGSIGLPELPVILFIALLVFGPGKLPEVGRSLGKTVREFRKALGEIKGESVTPPDDGASRQPPGGGRSPRPSLPPLCAGRGLSPRPTSSTRWQEANR